MLIHDLYVQKTEKDHLVLWEVGIVGRAIEHAEAEVLERGVWDVKIETRVEYPRWVTVYSITRHCGGPEEGGWWYNHYNPIESVQVTDAEDEQAMLERFKRVWEPESHGDIYSANGGCLYEVYVEDERYEGATTETPRYE